MKYFYSLLEEKLKVIDSRALNEDPDFFGFYQMWTLAKVLKKEKISEEDRTLRNRLFSVLTNQPNHEKIVQIKIRLSSMMEKDREQILSYLSELKQRGEMPEGYSRKYDKKGLIAVFNTEYNT